MERIRQGYLAKLSLGVVLAALALLAVSSASDPQSSGNAASYTGGAVQVTLEGYTQEGSNDWTSGNIRGYDECQNVPMRLTIDNAAGQAVTLTVQYDWQTADGTIYGLDYTGPSYPASGQTDAAAFTVEGNKYSTFAVAAGDTYAEANRIRKSYVISITPTENTVRILFGVHLALTTGSVLGASEWPGGKVHVSLLSPSKDVSIQTRESAPATATATATSTPVAPTATPTNTPVAPTATPTNTPVAPTATPTNTPVAPTATPTNTPVPTATKTKTPVPQPSDQPADPTPTPPPLAQVPAPTATPVIQVLAPPPPTVPVIEVLAPPILPKAGGLPIGGSAGLFTSGLLGLALSLLGLAVRRFLR